MDGNDAETGQISNDSESELEVTLSGSAGRRDDKSQPNRTDSAKGFRSSEYFMPYAPDDFNMAEERAYGVQSGSNVNFVEAANGVTMDLAGDEGGKGFGEARSVMRWDKRHKKYVSRQNDDDGSKGKRLVRGESGAKIAASFRSGRYDAWKKNNRVGRAPRTGENETRGGSTVSGETKRYKHRATKAPKQADKFRDDFERRKKKVAAAKERNMVNQGKQELRSVDGIRKERRLKEKRREKNARPSKKTRR
jgi:ATP-dependent RNA helicase DDX54/DBP10